MNESTNAQSPGANGGSLPKPKIGSDSAGHKAAAPFAIDFWALIDAYVADCAENAMQVRRKVADKFIEQCGLAFSEWMAVPDGTRIRVSSPTEKFWHHWHSYKAHVKALGVYSCKVGDLYFVLELSGTRKDHGHD